MSPQKSDPKPNSNFTPNLGQQKKFNKIVLFLIGGGVLLIGLMLLFVTFSSCKQAENVADKASDKIGDVASEAADKVSDAASGTADKLGEAASGVVDGVRDVLNVPQIDYTLTADQVHSKFSKNIPPILRVKSGAVIEAYTQEASAGQIKPGDGPEVLAKLDFDPIHPLTGPVYVEGAEPGDVLKVTLHDIELQDWGWTAILPGFSFLADQFTEPYLKTYEISPNDRYAQFTDKIKVPLKPFPGVMGVAPATGEMLSTIPPRENGGNMDDPHLTVGAVVYFPIFVEGALFSIGDAHATQGMGEVCGTAIEAPMRFVYEVEVIKVGGGVGRSIPEPEYETADTYAVTATGTTIDEAAKKSVAYMVDYLQKEHGLSRNDAYALCSLAGDLRIAEVVDLPNMMVAMHMSKQVLGMK